MQSAMPVVSPSTELSVATFRAMGCRIEIQVVSEGDPDTVGAVERAIEAVRTEFAAYEAELSRFLPASGVALLNRAAGAGPVRVTPLLRAVTEDALHAAARTDGLFDPTLGTVLAHLGYDRPFPLPLGADDAPLPALLPRHQRGAWRAIVVDRAGCTVTLPAGAALDFGGIGKGWTVDRLLPLLQAVPGVRGGLINAGGDLSVWGAAPDEEPAWFVGVEDPRALDRDCALLAVNDCAVATSSTAFRRWRRGERWLHHLLDPRTGRPAATDLAAVTVIGPSAAWAEVHAKVALLHGSETGRAYLETQPGYEGYFVRADGARAGTSGVGAFLA